MKINVAQANKKSQYAFMNRSSASKKTRTANSAWITEWAASIGMTKEGLEDAFRMFSREAMGGAAYTYEIVDSPNFSTTEAGCFNIPKRSLAAFLIGHFEGRSPKVKADWFVLLTRHMFSIKDRLRDQSLVVRNLCGILSAPGGDADPMIISMFVESLPVSVKTKLDRMFS